MDAGASLIRLKSELAERGWPAEMRGDALFVRNPKVAQLNDDVTCDGSSFRWPHGQSIGSIEDVRGVAAQIMHVLREVTWHGTEAGSS